MDNNNFQTTFIPKKPVVSESGTRSEGGINIFLLLSVVIFIVAIAVSALVYFGRSTLTKEIAERKLTLETKATEFEANTIGSLISLDRKLKLSTDIINKHLITSTVFEFVGSKTVEGIRFRNFSYSNTASSANSTGVSIKMSGVAKDFNTIAFQSDIFKKNLNIIKNPLFSDFAPNADGTVSFSFICDINPDLVSYAKVNSDSPLDTSDSTGAEPDNTQNADASVDNNFAN